MAEYLIFIISESSFWERPVDRKVLEEVMDIVRYAQSAGNVQPVKWVIFHDPVKVKKVTGLTIDGIKNVISKAPPDQDFTGFNLSG